MKTRHLVTVLILLASTSTNAVDWPQWQGPNRNSISMETGLLKEWPEGGPPLAWKIEKIGGGYSAPAIVGGRIYGMSNRDNDEVVWALSEKDGSEVWATRLGAAVTQGGRQGSEGPGCTPTIDGDRLYVLGAGGTIACLHVRNGNLVWKRSLTEDFGGRLPRWRYSESPLVDGDKVVCTPGGPDATLVALNKATGDTIWKSKLSAEPDSNSQVGLNRADSPQQPELIHVLQPEAPTIVVAAGSSWKYLDTGVAPDHSWTSLDFNDSEWAEGTAQFGYGDNDEKTKINDAAEGYPTYYFRKTFEVKDLAQLKPLILRLVRDDGAIVYLNGKELCRDNMPDGNVGRNTFATETTPVEDDFYVHEAATDQLVAGMNVIAVEVHQASATSSDVSFDLELRERTRSDRIGAPAARQRRFGGGRGGPSSDAGYSSAIAIDFDGKRQYVQLTATALVGVSATTGEKIWAYERPANRMRINCSTPIFHDNLIFASSAYGTGGGAVELKKNANGTIEAEEVYFTTRMQNHHGGMIAFDGCLYGANGGNGGGFLACLDFASGDVLWRDRKAPKGALAMADDRIYLYTEEGTMILIEPNREEYVERGRFDHPGRSSSPAWTHPVIANGKLYVRDQNSLLCYDVKAN